MLSKKKLCELSDGTRNVGCYIDKPRKSFCGEMCSTLDGFCHSGFLAYWSIVISKSRDLDSLHQPDMDIKFTENKRCCKIRKLLSYHIKTIFHIRKFFLSFDRPVLSIQKREWIVIRYSTTESKQTSQTCCSRVVNNKKYKFGLYGICWTSLGITYRKW